MLNLSKYINVPVFLVSLIMGLFVTYMTAPPQQSIYVYPSEENSGSVQFKDTTGTCFAFEPVAQDCPSDAEIFTVPIQ